MTWNPANIHLVPYSGIYEGLCPCMNPLFGLTIPSHIALTAIWYVLKLLAQCFWHCYSQPQEMVSRYSPPSGTGFQK